ncbi:MAG: type II toxin-antitoxin system ParD family antitoxin [Planctomycetota bacterium]|nr:MAG: type II toxin-antitoxin system ParD family antitoxin [Planctomycetota bacterium]
MSIEWPEDISASLENFISYSGYASEVEVMRDALAALQRERDLASLQEGIADAEAGRIRPWKEVKAELRAKYGHERR